MRAGNGAGLGAEAAEAEAATGEEAVDNFLGEFDVPIFTDATRAYEIGVGAGLVEEAEEREGKSFASGPEAEAETGEAATAEE